MNIQFNATPTVTKPTIQDLLIVVADFIRNNGASSLAESELGVDGAYILIKVCCSSLEWTRAVSLFQLLFIKSPITTGGYISYSYGRPSLVASDIEKCIGYIKSNSTITITD